MQQRCSWAVCASGPGKQAAMTVTYDRFADANASSNSSCLQHDIVMIHASSWAFYGRTIVLLWSANMHNFPKNFLGTLDPSMTSTPVCAICLQAVVPLRIKRPVNSKCVCWSRVSPFIYLYGWKWCPLVRRCSEDAWGTTECLKKKK